MNKISKLKEVRKARKITQEELANMIGISRTTIQSYEQGWRSVDGASLRTLVDICKVLKCNISDIIEDQNLVDDIETLQQRRWVVT